MEIEKIVLTFYDADGSKMYNYDEVVVDVAQSCMWHIHEVQYMYGLDENNIYPPLLKCFCSLINCRNILTC